MRVTNDRYVEGTHTYQCRDACYNRPLCGRNTNLLPTNAWLLVTVNRYVEGTPTYQCRQSTVTYLLPLMWKEHLLSTYQCLAACHSRPLCGRNTYLPMQGCVLQPTVMSKQYLLTNAGVRVTVNRYVEGTPTYQCRQSTVTYLLPLMWKEHLLSTYQCMAACHSRPLCGRNTYLPMQGCVLLSTVMWKEHILTNAWLRVTVDRYVEGME